jgi:hypothetical protein
MKAFILLTLQLLAATVSHAAPFQTTGLAKQKSKVPPSVPPPPKKNKKSGTTTTALSLPPHPRQSRFERFLQKLYDESDSNQDGSISFDEAYELMLKMYIKINQQAPIPPPTRGAAFKLYHRADKDGSNSISRDEFKWLANILFERALSRLVAHKAVTLFGAPFLAEFTLRKLAGLEWLPQLAEMIVPVRFHEKVLPTITSATFGRMVLLVVLVSTLGNAVLSMVNRMWGISLPSEETGKAPKRTRR